MMGVKEKLALGGCCCSSSYCKQSLRHEDAVHAVTWAWPCWDKSVVYFVMMIGDGRMERRYLSAEMGSRSIAVSGLGAEEIEIAVDGVGHIVGVEVSGFASLVYANGCLVVALGEQDMGLAWTLSDPEMVVLKVEVEVEVAV